MSEFKIEVGKFYKTRGGDLQIEIVGMESPHAPLYNPSAPYLGDDDEVYTETGRFNGQTFDSEFDLVEEVE